MPTECSRNSLKSSSAVPATSGAIPGKVTTSDLPPCRICGDNSSGFHYGVNTCEACKSFYRRCLKRTISSHCRYKTGCTIVPERGTAYCAPCRYKRCISVGMSTTAIKTGRYTHEKRSKNLEQLQQLKSRGKTKEDEELEEQETKMKELEAFIEQVTLNHIKQLPSSPQFYDNLKEKEKEFLETHNRNQELTGDTSTLSFEDYQSIYESTGLDFDGRREWMKKMLPGMEKNILRFITFVKGIPGFRDLPTEDQIIIIKVARNHTELVRWSHFLCRDTGVFYSPHVDAFTHISDYKKVLPEFHDIINKTTMLFEQIQDLELTPEEHAIYSAIAVMNAPTGLSHMGWMVRDYCVDKLGDALQHLLERRTDAPGIIIGRLVNILIELETLDQEYLIYIESSLYRNYPGVVDPEQLSLLLEVAELQEVAKESYSKGQREITKQFGSVSLGDHSQKKQ